MTFDDINLDEFHPKGLCPYSVCQVCHNSSGLEWGNNELKRRFFLPCVTVSLGIKKVSFKKEKFDMPGGQVGFLIDVYDQYDTYKLSLDWTFTCMQYHFQVVI